MDWLDRLNRSDRHHDLGCGRAEILYWAHNRELPDNAPHRHTYFELCQVGAHGAGLFRVEGQSIALGPGDLFVARPGVIHQIVNTTVPWMELYWVSYQLGPPPGGELRGILRTFAESPLALVADESRRVAGAWRALREMAPGAGSESLRYLVGAFLLTVAEAFGAPEEADLPRRPGEQRASSAARVAVRYIHDNLDRPLSSDEVARQAGVSRRHLSRLMRAHVGASFHEYVLWARLHMAAHLLRRTDLAVKVVGAQVGYPDVHHFTRVFSRHIGHPPAAYRRGAGGAAHVPNVQTPGTLV